MDSCLMCIAEAKQGALFIPVQWDVFLQPDERECCRDIALDNSAHNVRSQVGKLYDLGNVPFGDAFVSRRFCFRCSLAGDKGLIPVQCLPQRFLHRAHSSFMGPGYVLQAIAQTGVTSRTISQVAVKLTFETSDGLNSVLTRWRCASGTCRYRKSLSLRGSPAT